MANATGIISLFTLFISIALSCAVDFAASLMSSMPGWRQINWLHGAVAIGIFFFWITVGLYFSSSSVDES